MGCGARTRRPTPLWVFDGYTSSPNRLRHPQTAPQEGSVTADAHVSREVREADLLRAAFRDLHGASLHGFTLLVTLGDRRRAEAAAASALAAGARQAGTLRHPERAAAWLRAAALRALRRPTLRRRRPGGDERTVALHALGATDGAIAGLTALSLLERASLVASGIERLEPIDLETVLGQSRSATRRLITAARRRYLAAVQRATNEPITPPPGGPLHARIAATAARALGSVERGRG